MILRSHKRNLFYTHFQKWIKHQIRCFPQESKLIKDNSVSSTLTSSTIINVRNGCPAVKTAGHPEFPGFFILEMPVKKECDFMDIIGVNLRCQRV